MIRAQLTMALDFARKKGAPEVHERFSYRQGEQWYIVSHGPTYHNTLKVTDFDDEGLKLLLAKEQKENPPTDLATEPPPG